MLTDKEIKEIREHLDKAQNPLFFFDNDADGLCSFLLLARYCGKGRGVAIKSFPDLNESYSRKLHELNPDYVFVLDKPIISEGFIEGVRKLNLPLVWIDHHDVSENKAKIPEDIYYYNPTKNKDKSSEPATYLCWKISEKKEDLWLGMVGCIGDAFLPDFIDEFDKKYKELWKPGINTAFQAVYETDIGKITRIFNFALKDRTSNVVRMLKFLLKIKNPSGILLDDNKNHILFRFNQVNNKYQKLIEKARQFVREKLIYFQYGGDLSLSSDISNELRYRFPNKFIVVVYLKGGKANISLRGKGIKKITLKAIEGLDDATGGGHEDATGAKINIEDLPKFKEKIEKLVGS